MSKKQVNIRLEDDMVDYLDSLEAEGEAGNRAEAGRRLMESGWKRYQERERLPGIAQPTKHGLYLASLSSVVALSVGIGIGEWQVIGVASMFATVAFLFGTAYATMVFYARQLR